MKYILSDELKEHFGKNVCLKGWVKNYRRASSKLRFIVFRDGKGEVQAVAFRPNMKDRFWEIVKSLTIETSLILKGTPKVHPKFSERIEFHISEIKIIGTSKNYPISKKKHGVDFLLSNRHLWLRSSKQIALQKIRHTIYFAICNYLNENNFYRFDSPILTPNTCEGTTTLFELPYFDIGKAYLSQSGQLYLEAGVMALGRVYDFGPVFRAEKSKTRKHLTEFWMMDAEACFVDHKQNMQIQQELIRHVIRETIQKNKEELNILDRNINRLYKADTTFEIITHKQAVNRLRDLGFDLSYQDDFGAEHEKALTTKSDTPLFIEKWPKNLKSFYMKLDSKDSNLTLGSDLLASEGFGEIIGGSERETNFYRLKQRMEEEKLPLEKYQWYLDLRKYGTVPHSGFGIGFERLVGWIAGIKHIRETIPFPRMIYRLFP